MDGWMESHQPLALEGGDEEDDKRNAVPIGITNIGTKREEEASAVYLFSLSLSLSLSKLFLPLITLPRSLSRDCH